MGWDGVGWDGVGWDGRLTFARLAEEVKEAAVRVVLHDDERWRHAHLHASQPGNRCSGSCSAVSALNLACQASSCWLLLG